jgi:ribosomal protein S12 methylthiotransferase accessory factor
LLERLLAANITEVVAVDLTRPELGLPVVKVVIPGLEGSDHYEYVPGQRALAARGRQP